ncbi:hypothetical protein MOQ_005917 [Trypanosoma cruzi marinkellei]|uniref:Uncharacterized protein n=1 Tax=Trypanosoma cruzi marinkellei TaxID=85056 RepID=K2N6J1_TRYCR|nr:hypothetical protein MOQ_005917 [Trypanosoma cruzi marinkellei]
MVAPTTDEKDAKLTDLVKTMFERVPKEKRLTAEVVMQLLKAKYLSTFPAEYLTDRAEFLAGLIDSLYSKRSNDKKVSDANGNSHDNDDDEDDDDDDEDDDDDSSQGDEEEDGEEEEDEEEEEEEEFESDESNETGGENDDTDGAPVEKRQRLEEGASDVARRCHEMSECLRRLSYRSRKREDGESYEAYLEQYLVPLFQEKGLDPERYGKEDVRRYRVKRELEQLKSDGADVNLDRTARAGRGLNRLALNKDATVSIKTSKFLDEE